MRKKIQGNRRGEMLRAIGVVTINAAAGGRKKPVVSIEGYSGGILRGVAGFGSVVIDLAGMTVPGRITLLADHDSTLKGVVGTAAPAIAAGKLTAAGTLSLATEAGRTLLQLVDDGVALQASVGADPLEYRHVPEGQSVKANGRTIKAGRGGLVFVTKSTLREISILPMGADTATAISIAASGAAAGGADGLEDDQDDDRTPEQIRAAAAAESLRVADARRVCAAYTTRIDAATLATIEATAIAEGWDKSRVELDLIRAARPKPPEAGTYADRGLRAGGLAAMECALCLSAGMSEKFLGDHYDEPVMNEALSARFRDAGIHALLRHTIRAAGRHEQFDRIGNEAIRAAFESDRMIRASGFSTISLSGILSNVANKSMLEAYATVATSWNEFCAIASNKDFKAAKRYRLSGQGRFEEVAASGELKHITLKEDEYGAQLATEGAMIALTRQMIINDDLQSFLQLPRIFARMSLVALEKAVFTVWLANEGNFFHADNSNYQEGSGTALSIDSLSEAEQLFLQQVDVNGDPILVIPSVLLVPPALRSIAFQLATSTELRDTTASKKAPTGNPHIGRFKPVVSPWLKASGLSGGSDKAWYITSAPSSGVNAIEVAFLNGKQTPTVESGETDFNTLGVQMRAYHDFGVAMQDPIGAVKSKGEA